MSLSIAVIVGSLRKESFNRRLANALTRLPAAQVHSFVFPEIGTLPLYDQDDDAHQAEAVLLLKEQIRASDGVIFVTPEYNRSIPGVLKNAIDHASRPYGQSAWMKKPVGIIGVSPSPLGTAPAQGHLRAICHVLNMPLMGHPEAYVQYHDAFFDESDVPSEKHHDFLDGWMKAFIAHARLYVLDQASPGEGPYPL